MKEAGIGGKAGMRKGRGKKEAGVREWRPSGLRKRESNSI